MAEAKKAIDRFSGELASPIRLERPGLGLYAPEILRREIARKQSEKLFALFAHFDIEPTDVDRWMKLSGRLACTFVPGMIPVFEDRFQPKTRKDKDEGYALVDAVDAIRTKIGNGKPGKIYAAVFELVEQQPETWGQYKGRELTLVGRYKRHKKVVIQQAAMLEQMRRLGKVPLGSKEWIEIASSFDTKDR